MAVPRSFDFSVDSSASVEQIYWAFAERDYWRARLAKFSNSAATLQEFAVDSEGLVTSVVVNEVGRDGVAGPFAKFFPVQWRIEQKETWIPIGDGRVRGEIATVSHGAPGAGGATALLAPTRDGSRLKCKATVEFKVPLLGGQIENVMGRSLKQSISVLQQFTADWIRENA